MSPTTRPGDTASNNSFLPTSVPPPLHQRQQQVRDALTSQFMTAPDAVCHDCLELSPGDWSGLCPEWGQATPVHPPLVGGLAQPALDFLQVPFERVAAATLVPSCPSEVLLWLLRLERHTARPVIGLLSDDERRRAAQFRLEADRKRFVVTRAALRTLLATYLGEPASVLDFEYGPYGRPQLARPPRMPELSFSVAHSGAFSIIALGFGVLVGVDIEDLALERDTTRIAAASMTDAEHCAWLGRAPGERKAALLQWWTRREAVGKALGMGLTMTAQALAGAVQLKVANFAPAEGCVAAIAAGAQASKIRLTEFEP